MPSQDHIVLISKRWSYRVMWWRWKGWKFLSPSAFSAPTLYSINSPNSAMRDLVGLNLEGGYCYTPCNTIPELRSLLPLDPCSFPRPLLHIHYFPILHSNFKPWFCFWNSIYLTLPDPPHSMPVPVYPDWGFCNPISDLLIPLLHSQPCIVPSCYKNEPQCTVDAVWILTKLVP